MNKLGWVPTTVDECMKAFTELLTLEEQAEIVCCASKDKLIVYHHGLGRWIRNNWGLWAGGPLLDHMKSLGFRHPDDMSQCLIEEWWSRMNIIPSTMEDDIKKYAAYWDEKGVK